MNFLQQLAPYAKAVAAFIALLVPVLVSLGVLLTDVSQGQLQTQDFVTLGAAVAALLGGTHAVYTVTNKPLK